MSILMAISDEKYATKQQTLIQRTASALGVNHDKAMALLRIGRRQSVRVNTLKTTIEEANVSMEELGISVEPVSWWSGGFYLNGESAVLSASKPVADGELYIQNAASWLPVIALNVHEGDMVLDMCAAPGGKTSHIAQQGNNTVALTANDNSRPRLLKLQRNLERLGVTNVEYTLYDASNLAYHLQGKQFHKILLDAPCSGEGMMTLESRKDFESWSVAHIKRLQKLQKKLIVQAWKLLEPGGTLVYSTCTMAPEENEAVIDYLLRHNDDVQVEPLQIEGLANAIPPVSEWNGRQFDQRVSDTLRLAPSEQIEAFYVAKLTKTVGHQ